jgi:hypothetical protein
MKMKVNDKVKLLKTTRHGMVKAGAIGRVVEIRNKGCEYTDGVAVEFMVLPTPMIARMFGEDPKTPKPYNCLFPHKAVARSLKVV